MMRLMALVLSVALVGAAVGCHSCPSCNVGGATCCGSGGCGSAPCSGPGCGGTPAPGELTPTPAPAPAAAMGSSAMYLR